VRDLVEEPELLCFRQATELLEREKPAATPDPDAEAGDRHASAAAGGSCGTSLGDAFNRAHCVHPLELLCEDILIPHLNTQMDERRSQVANRQAGRT
jgi:hypothetical protein